MPFLNNQQRKKLAGLREAAAGETRTANGYEARAEQLDLEGRHDMAKEARKAAASHRRARQNTDQEIAGRQADPGKWRW